MHGLAWDFNTDKLKSSSLRGCYGLFVSQIFMEKFCLNVDLVFFESFDEPSKTSKAEFDMNVSPKHQTLFFTAKIFGTVQKEPEKHDSLGQTW